MDNLPRSTRAGRGELAGPAPSPRQVRQADVRIEQVEPGVMQVSMPAIGWRGGQARNAHQLAALVATAFRESQVAAYARFRGSGYTAADDPGGCSLAYQRPKPTRPGRRVDVHDPREWRKDTDGMWISPGSGRRFRPESQVVQRVQAQLARMWESPPQAPSESTS